MYIIGLLFYIGVPVFAYYLESAWSFIETSFSLSPEITVLIGIAYIYPLSVFLMSVVFRKKGFANITYFRSQVTLSSTLSVSFGLIGTFIGLSQMIAGIAAGMGADGDFTSKMASLLDAISTALDSMSLAFLTSILGVGASVAILFSSNYLSSFFRENDSLKSNEENNNASSLFNGLSVDEDVSNNLNDIKNYLEQTLDLVESKEKVWSDLYLLLEKSTGSGVVDSLNKNIERNISSIDLMRSELENVRKQNLEYQNLSLEKMNELSDGIVSSLETNSGVINGMSSSVDEFGGNLRGSLNDLHSNMSNSLTGVSSSMSGSLQELNTNMSGSLNELNTNMSNSLDKFSSEITSNTETISNTVTETSSKLQSVSDILHDIRIQMAIPLDESLKTALSNDGLDLVYQPQVDHDGKISGAEVYVRWNEPVRGLVPSNVLFETAEKYGMLVQLDHWVLKSTIKQVKQWVNDNALVEGFIMSININHENLVSPSFLNYMEQLLEEYELDSSLFAFEVTENTIMNYPEEARDKIRQISRMGFHVYIDDFGTGYSSLVNLKNFKIDMLKIDREIVQGLLEYSDKDESIIRSIMNIAQEMNIKVSAEGIETQEHFDKLKTAGCSMFQGYFLGRPVDSTTFTDDYLAK